MAKRGRKPKVQDAESSVDEKVNFKCLCKLPGNHKTCGEVFNSKQAINAHFTHGHKRKIKDDLWEMTADAPTKESKYNPEWGKGRRAKRAATIGGVAGGQVSGTLSIPVILQIEFAFTPPVISQDIAPQVIDLSGGKRGRGRRGQE